MRTSDVSDAHGANAQADLSLHAAHMPEGTFSHVTAYMYMSLKIFVSDKKAFGTNICKRPQFQQFKMLSYLFWVWKSHFSGLLDRSASRDKDFNNSFDFLLNPFCINVLLIRTIWASAWQNQQNGMCTQQRLKSAWASAQFDQSLRCPHEGSLGP